MAACLVTTTSVLEQTCESSVDDVKELVLRSGGYEGFEEVCASRLASLELLSLSHNKLTALTHFGRFENLLSLNLNFNGLLSLEGLACRRLKRLYLSNNRLVSLTELRSFPDLHTLCCYRNRLDDLSAALQDLKPLKALRELDLDGNPCAFDRSYRHRVVDQLVRLQALDGEPVESLDKEVRRLSLRSRATVLFMQALVGAGRGRFPSLAARQTGLCVVLGCAGMGGSVSVSVRVSLVCVLFVRVGAGSTSIAEQRTFPSLFLFPLSCSLCNGMTTCTYTPLLHHLTRHY